LVLIVSEERGTVSIACDGRLIEVSSPADLKLRIERFLEETCPTTKPKLWRGLFRHSGLKLVSVATAALGWLLFARHGDTIEQTFVVPIEYRNIPAKLCLDDHPAAEARLTLSGPEPAFALLSPDSLRVRIDLGRYEPGNAVVHLTERDCAHPAELRVYRIEPRVLHFRLVPCPTRSTKKDSARLLDDPRSQKNRPALLRPMAFSRPALVASLTDCKVR
jgi:hypothetical protein